MLKALFFAVLVSSIGLADVDAIRTSGAGRKMLVRNTPDVDAVRTSGTGRKMLTGIAFGPACTNSYFKSDPGFKPTPGKEYKPCCDKSMGFICATYSGSTPFSTYAACMTLEACKASNGGEMSKFPGWDCGPLDNNPFPQCQNYYARR